MATADLTKPERATATSADDTIATTARQVAETVAGAAGDVTARLPHVAKGTRDAVTEANRMVRGGSDQTLRLAGASAIGFAIGLLVGGANRALVILSLAPAALIAAALLERAEGAASGPGATTRLQGR